MNRPHDHVPQKTHHRQWPRTSDRGGPGILHPAAKQPWAKANEEVDHLHPLTAYPPKAQLSTLIGAIKTNTSHEITARNYLDVKRTPWGDHFCSPSSLALSSAGAMIETIREYILNQCQPNKKVGRPKTS